MLSKLVLFLAATVALGARLKVTPDELKVNLLAIDQEVRDLQVKAAEDVRATLIPLLKLTDDAKKQFSIDMRSAAEEYWYQIESLEDEAKKIGKDISLCVQIGNQKLYKLNETLITERRADIDKIAEEGQQNQLKAINDVENTLHDLQVISEKVFECSDDTCATILDGELVEYYEQAVKIFDSATETMNNFLMVYLPEALDNLKLDVIQYQKSYTPFLQDVKKCINL